MKNRGFTLIELVVTVSIVAILATVAIPSFRTLLVSNNTSSQANALVSALNLARSEAIKQSQTATVCVSADGATCGTVATACSAGTGWACGWLVWVDTNGDGVMQATEIVRVGSALKGSFNLTNSLAVATQQYLATGLVTPATITNFKLCDTSNNYPGRTISISATGRVSTAVSTCP